VCRPCLAEPKPFEAEFFCVSCRTPFVNRFPLDEEGRCGLCRSSLRGFDAAYCYGAYEGALRELIHVFKYGRVATLSRALSRYLLSALPQAEGFDAVTPVPLHWFRRWQRGFNQSALLAWEVGRQTGLPVLNLLRRVRATPTQAGLSKTLRRRNVAGAFRSVRGSTQLHGLRILLIDDVMTTGSTAASCALALKRAGAARVAVLTLARADRRLRGWRSEAATHSVAGGAS
jgi:ComF family protein